ncbi:HelD family protein [Aestuariimicrobium ganziense]|uniref:HelD family protein n=1 Tax=Aestuariimicrobium ganziense TaxID=2773677 RepID=UPI001944F769|nr:ATP-binding domain-containing protein [Aestuariimicrobium ganziense]
MPDAVIAAERAHLERAREALAGMRSDTADWRTASAGDHVSTQILKQMLFRRMKSLQDDPTVPLFFGRIDYRADLGADEDETCHIGRRHVAASLGGDPLVMDWRAPMALPFYRARPDDPMGIGLRRRFGFHHGQITAYEDESLTSGAAGHSTILEDEIERPRTGPMRDIVATIQPDQDVLVRTPLEQSMAIQGAPGTGKTAVGLHRAAYLLYAHRQQLSRTGVMVIGPNDAFLGYIGDVLPALGEIDATQETVESLVSAATGLSVKGADEPAVGVLKGDPRMATLLHRALWSHVGEPSEMLVVPVGHRQVRVPTHQVVEAVHGVVERGVRYEAGRVMVPQRLAHQVLLRLEVAGETTDDRVQAAVARTPAVKAMAKQLWPAVKATTLVHQLLSDAGFLATHADGLLEAGEQSLLIGTKPPRSPGSRRWTLADLVLVDEVVDLLTRTPSLGHVIVDEAQDLSAMMLRAAGRRATTGSVTLLGDLAQATTPWGLRDWTAALSHIGHTDAVVNELVEGFRVPGDVIKFAARLLPSIAPDLTLPRSVRRNRGDLVVRRADPLSEVGPVAAELLEREGTLGVIVPPSWVDEVSDRLDRAQVPHSVLGRERAAGPNESDVLPSELITRVEVVDSQLAKGLEFDHVLLLEPATMAEAEPDEVTGLRRLYVCLTRAVSSLTVLHSVDLPAALR